MEDVGGKGLSVSPDVNNLYARLFVDDVWALSDSWNQTKIYALDLFCDSTGMKAKLNKPKVIVFGQGGPLWRAHRNCFILQAFKFNIYAWDCLV